MKEPKIRFNEFKGEWKEKELNSLASYICSGKNTNMQGPYPLYGSTGIIGTTDKPYHTGPMLLVARVGANAGYLQLIEEECGVSDNTLIIQPNNELPEKYLFYYFDHFNLNRFIYGSGQPLITGGMLKKMPVRFGCTTETRKLASFFTTLDAQISASTSRLASLKQIKAASLQAMFPQEGETVPKLRFKGFEGEWEKVKLGELFSERLERSDIGEMLSVTMNNGIIKAADNGRFDNSSEDKSNYKVVKVGDIAYNTMRMWQGACGCSLYKGIVSPAYTVVVPNDGVYSSFFAYYFKTQSMINLFRLNSQGLTKDTWNLKYNVFKLIELLSPNNIAEQCAIASFFTNLDRQITLQSQRLEKLKQIKAACLDKMFV